MQFAYVIMHLCQNEPINQAKRRRKGFYFETKNKNILLNPVVKKAGKGFRNLNYASEKESFDKIS